MITSA